MKKIIIFLLFIVLFSLLVVADRTIIISERRINDNSSVNLSASTCSAGNYSYYNGTGFECSPDLQGTGGSGTLTGSGTAGYVPVWNGTTSMNNSLIQQVEQAIIINQSGWGFFMNSTKIIIGNLSYI